MKEQIVMDILREMTAILTQEQLMRLKEVVRVQLCGYDIRKKETTLMRTDQNWLNYLQMYLDGFRQNGKSTGTIEQYNLHLSRMLSYVAKNVQDIEDDDLISYMYKYRALRKVSNRYLNNMRLVFNSFFRWLQRRKVIFRNPVDGLYVGLYVYKERWFDFNAFAGTRLWIARYYRGYRTMRFDDEPDQKYKPDVDGDISGWQYTSCGEIPGIKGDVDLDIAYEDPMLWSQPAVEPGVIYTVSVADVWTREQAEILRQQFEAMGINGIIHEVRIVE